MLLTIIQLTTYNNKNYSQIKIMENSCSLYLKKSKL